MLIQNTGNVMGDAEIAVLRLLKGSSAKRKSHNTRPISANVFPLNIKKGAAR